MNQQERRVFMIKYLIGENQQYRNIDIPTEEQQQKMLLRSLMNVREPGAASEEFLTVQDEYLQEELRIKGVTELSQLREVMTDIYLWQGDITRLRCGAIVNAANSGMTGCYHPCHSCIDNCIHTYAGVQLRNYCHELMVKQGFEEPVGQAKITPAFNLPCDYVLHTVGPVVQGELSRIHRKGLESCYNSCLKAGDENGVGSIAFCCISTGVFMFPNEEAAKIALKTVLDYKKRSGSGIKVIFNVFANKDREIYENLFSKGQGI